ncbi:hypothetical protein TVAG_331210 [Trichomonas vaginalis G3]|uniref:Uncharacterized protein n=1 Tax=Trichomonas vaginalis (strain ATCC PRA-98 / G3) TaxID=412133 RepID=A2FC40_TRIV3|nr:hypothetical protein TVAGG3_0757180 [Trichomonas vaginalis G3]EAX97535.1 hypothetical protein TVAG_331210 [Trichomonas vaginalis G3]KAI5512945.1 hypothetical protein TVAGG3_0757180 [Trichomonas vaginalis G3]|eukprot:XP_001310465.1 hypothetical protein [Trichomonas vaginalis G3]
MPNTFGCLEEPEEEEEIEEIADDSMVVILPDEIAAHIGERTHNPHPFANYIYDKYIHAQSEGLRVYVMNFILKLYYAEERRRDTSNKSLMEKLSVLRQAIALMIWSHMMVDEQGRTYVSDYPDKKIVYHWAGILDVIARDYASRHQESREVVHELCMLRNRLKDEVAQGIYPELGYPIPSREEFQNFMGNRNSHVC